ncbi:hypothetical protein [Acidovorax sp. SUPP2825]|uniref:hypothetical protein n=1 Tax=Acidovorax sp. SUPP2825 TaxID=2920879 RepID=UPI0023DE6A4F|nr:hypothetical protein [Acidovorax sp. SUPP2825]GKS96934.1 hypothetical protein AVAK2825_20385 [Acidovorax sp. SUPP2825]
MNARVELIAQAEYARRRGVAKSAVAKAVAEGRITLINGKVDPAVADIQWAQNTRARADSGRTGAASAAVVAGAAPVAEIAAGGPESAPLATGTPGYTDYRTIREKADAEMAQRANLKDAGLLVERARVERGIHDVVHTFRDAVMAIAQRAAPKCVGVADARDIEHLITDETRKALAAFEARLLALLPPKETT